TTRKATYTKKEKTRLLNLNSDENKIINDFNQSINEGNKKLNYDKLATNNKSNNNNVNNNINLKEFKNVKSDSNDILWEGIIKKSNIHTLKEDIVNLKKNLETKKSDIKEQSLGDVLNCHQYNDTSNSESKSSNRSSKTNEDKLIKIFKNNINTNKKIDKNKKNEQDVISTDMIQNSTILEDIQHNDNIHKSVKQNNTKQNGIKQKNNAQKNTYEVSINDHIQ
ncbi:hypothetical protein HEP_00524700, partial [Hepatocystis sp. ex Piliocolobus tephrosceles]